MPSTDPTFGWPVPDDSDPLADGASAIRQLAAAVAAEMGPPPVGWTYLQGSVQVNVGSGGRGSQTFSYGATFIDRPMLIAETGNDYMIVRVTQPSASSATCRVFDVRATTYGNLTVNWHAWGWIQP